MSPPRCRPPGRARTAREPRRGFIPLHGCQRDGIHGGLRHHGLVAHGHPRGSCAPDTLFAHWTLDQVTRAQDPTLVEPSTGDHVEERLRVTVVYAIASPDALDERFREWDNGPNAAPRDWTLVSGGAAPGGDRSSARPRSGSSTRPARDTDHPATLARRAPRVSTGTSGSGRSTARPAVALARGPLLALPGRPRVDAYDGHFDAPRSGSATRSRSTADANARGRHVPPGDFRDGPVERDPPRRAPDHAVPLGEFDLDRHFVPLLFWDRATDQHHPRPAPGQLDSHGRPRPAARRQDGRGADSLQRGVPGLRGPRHLRRARPLPGPAGDAGLRDTLRDTATHLGINVSPGGPGSGATGRSSAWSRNS